MSSQIHPDLAKLLQKFGSVKPTVGIYVERTYRKQFNAERFRSFLVSHKETDLWIGVDHSAYHNEMEELVIRRVRDLRETLDLYITREPAFLKSLKPFTPGEDAPGEAREMAKAAETAGVGPMAAVAGLFAREAGKILSENFSIREMVIENGGDIYCQFRNELILSVFAGESPLSERIGIVIPEGFGIGGICTSAGTVGPSLSFGKADAVVAICEDVLLADAYATAFGNKVKSSDDVERVIGQAEKYPGLLSLLIICGDKVGIWGDLEIRFLK